MGRVSDSPTGVDVCSLSPEREKRFLTLGRGEVFHTLRADFPIRCRGMAAAGNMMGRTAFWDFLQRMYLPPGWKMGKRVCWRFSYDRYKGGFMPEFSA